MQSHTRPNTPRLFAVLALIAATSQLFAGPLNPPPGPVASTPGPEPRIAISAANTPGDTDSLFRIAQPGSYYLTGNITGVAAKHGIEIAASGVTLDLNGFDLIGIAGSLDGVTSSLPGATNTTVVNGSVRSWGGDGVDLGFAPSIASRLRDLTCSANAGFGVRSGFNAIVSDCVASQNTGGGFTIASGTQMIRCTAAVNGAIGVNAGGTSVIADCLIERNTDDGVRATSDCTIRGNTCIANGFGAGDGAGIHLSGGGNRVEGNLCSDNDRGVDTDSGGNFIVRNTCAGNTTAYFLAANNVFGPIVDRRAPASAGVNGFAAPSSLGSTDPNANFSY